MINYSVPDYFQFHLNIHCTKQHRIQRPDGEGGQET